MTAETETYRQLRAFLERRREEILAAWTTDAFFQTARRQDSEQSTIDAGEILRSLERVLGTQEEHDPAARAFDDVRTLLGLLTSRQAKAGHLATEVAAELARLKDPVLRLWSEEDVPPEQITAGAVALSTAVDTLRLVVLEVALNAGADTIALQRQQLTELSTPVLKLWDGVLAIPLIGTLDSMRSQVATESLLQAIVDQQARIAILDITGVPAVDTMVAQHLLKTAMAARLMGAECIISGIRPQIAQTMVQLGIDLGELATRATLADALAYALRKVGLAVTED